MLRVLIADDHAIFRRGIRDLLRERFSPITIKEADTGVEMLARAGRRAWDLFIMDIAMPGKSGMDLLQDLRSMRPSTPVLVFSVHPETPYAARMIRSGASGYLNKATSLDQLAFAIETILGGRRYIAPHVADCLLAESETSLSKCPHEQLSDREFQIFQLLASGKPLKDVAQMLRVSPNTISTYRNRVLEKLGVRNNAEITRYAIDHTLIE